MNMRPLYGTGLFIHERALAALPALAAGSGGFVPRCCPAETEIGGEAAVRLVESDPDSQVMFVNG